MDQLVDLGEQYLPCLTCEPACQDLLIAGCNTELYALAIAGVWHFCNEAANLITWHAWQPQVGSPCV